MRNTSIQGMAPSAGDTGGNVSGSTVERSLGTNILPILSSSIFSVGISYSDSGGTGGSTNTLSMIWEPQIVVHWRNNLSHITESIGSLSIPIDSFLSPNEIEDVLESRLERGRGEGKVFTSADDLFAWLDSE